MTGIVELNTDYSIKGLTAPRFRPLSRRGNGAISRDTMTDLFRRITSGFGSVVSRDCHEARLRRVPE
jgi:hypothetical protein